MMTITELIRKLEEIKAQHGDLPVYLSIWDGSGEEDMFDVELREPGRAYNEDLPRRVFFQ